MVRIIWIGISFAIFSVWSTWTISDDTKVLVGIFGDVHSQIPQAQSAFEAMKNRGVTHLIGMGDYIEVANESTGQSERIKENLRQILRLMSETTGVPKKNTYLIPGNWEESLKPNELQPILAEFGSTPTWTSRRPGVIYINTPTNVKTVVMSHSPIHTIPQRIFPNESTFRYSKLPIDAQSTLPPVEGTIDLEIFADTHVHGTYFNNQTGHNVLNPGTLHPERKSAAEKLSFAVYDPELNQIEFIQPDGRVIKKAKLGIEFRVSGLQPTGKTAKDLGVNTVVYDIHKAPEANSIRSFKWDEPQQILRRPKPGELLSAGDRVVFQVHPKAREGIDFVLEQNGTVRWSNRALSQKMLRQSSIALNTKEPQLAQWIYHKLGEVIPQGVKNFIIEPDHPAWNTVYETIREGKFIRPEQALYENPKKPWFFGEPPCLRRILSGKI